MRNTFFDNKLEFDPLYSKVDYELSQLEDNFDPLGVEDHKVLVNWLDLIEDIEKLLSQQKNIRVLVWRMRAGLHVEGFSSFYKYLQEIREIIVIIFNFEQLSEEEQDIVSSFASELSWLSTSRCLSELRDSNILSEIKLSVRTILDIDFYGKENRLLYSDFITCQKKANDFFLENELPVLIEQVQLNIKLLDEISFIVNERSDGYTLDLSHLTELFNRLLFKINSTNEVEDKEEPSAFVLEDKKIDLLVKSDQGDLVPDIHKSIRSRTEVILLLEKVLEYFHIYEPSHPATVLIRRTKKMIGMDFESIIQELLPEAVESLKLYSGSNQSKQDDNLN